LKSFPKVRAGSIALALGLMLAATVPSPSSASPRQPFVFRTRSSSVSVPVRRPAARLRAAESAPTGCSTSDSSGFRGVADSDDIPGGYNSAVVAGQSNEACDQDSVIGGGADNTVGTSGLDSFIAAGDNNGISSTDSFIGAGFSGNVSGQASFLGAGDYYNYYFGSGAPGNEVAGTDSFLGSGDGNAVNGNQAFLGSGSTNAANASASFVGAGQNNTIGAAAADSSITGGARNTVTGEYASVLGGFGNLASGAYAVVAGGDGTTAGGELSFAAGYHADPTHSGSFAWSDFGSGSSLLRDTAANQFLARASGGVYFFSNEAMTSGVKLGPGSGTWASLSDRNAKTDVVPLDDASILAKVTALPISTWRYKSESGVRHAGPMAQDFYAAFGIGEDDRHITSIDEDGIALAAIKALHRENALMQRRLASLATANAGLAARDANLERRLDALSKVVKI
jgi:hypothetical protein